MEQLQSRLSNLPLEAYGSINSSELLTIMEWGKKSENFLDLVLLYQVLTENTNLFSFYEEDDLDFIGEVCESVFHSVLAIYFRNLPKSIAKS